MTESTEIERRKMFKEAVSNVEFCAQLVMKQLEGEERNACLKELKTVMLEYCDLDTSWQLEKKILMDIEQSLTEECNVSKIDEMYANLRKKKIDADPKKHEWYINLEKKIQEGLASEDSDCDIVSVGMTQSVLDPFTKQQMTDPVKNVRCGHSYERVTVLSVLQQRKELRCPVAGCAFKGTFNQSHLEDDIEMLRQLRKLSDK